MGTSEAQEIKKQETLVRFSIISYKTRLRVHDTKEGTVDRPFMTCILYENCELGY